MQRLLGLCLALVIAPPVHAEPPARAADVARFEAATEAAWRKDGLASVTVGVVREGRLQSTRSFGMADIENGTPASRTTI